MQAAIVQQQYGSVMIAEDQVEVIDFLASPAAHGGLPVERVETHASIVFLAGTSAWKLKRAVRYDYLDFSTLDRRKVMCLAELSINRRTAPDLYRRVVPVTRQPDGSLALNGSGTPMEWLVEMVRFDQDGLFDRLAERHALDLALMRPLAGVVADLHRTADRRSDHGGTSGMRWVVEGNASGLAEFEPAIFDAQALADLAFATRAALEHHADILESRRYRGFVRQGHGDLHLRNIVLIGDRPVLFDGIEFNDEIACTDVFYDLAFLLMDLWRRGLDRHANAVLNGYVAATGDVDGLPLLPLFLSCRAAVRAKTSATAATMQSDRRRAGELTDAARGYVSLARRLLHPPPACLVAVGGFSGSGKSTMARKMAPALGAVPGAVVLRSDEIRKALLGVPAEQRLGSAGYTEDLTARVYATLIGRAANVASTGHTAVVDAVWARAADREAMERAAAAAGIPFLGLWLDAPEAVLTARVAERHGDASDADAEVVRRQHDAGAGLLQWSRIDASGPIEAVERQVMQLLAQQLGGHLNSGLGPF